MRTISTDLGVVLNNVTRRVDMRVFVEDGDAVFRDITNFKGQDWVLSATWGDDIDSSSVSATIIVAREIYNDSMAPLMKVTRTNLNAGGAWDPILFLKRQIYIEVRYGPADVGDMLPWVEVFRGQIDTIDWGSWEIKLSCRDKMALLQDTFIETEILYSTPSGVAVQTVMQSILDNVLGAAVVTLYTPVSPGWNVTEFNSERQSLFNQLIMLVDQIGWRLKYLWDSGTSAFRLTLIAPARTKVAIDRTFNQDQYTSIDEFAVDLKNVRNAITIEYPDPADLNQNGNPKQKSVTRTRAASITAYGRRWIGITESATSLLDTSAEATALADFILDDLETPKVTKTVKMPLFIPVELDDLYTYTANDVHYSDNFSAAVVSYTHTISDSEVSTSLGLRESAPAGKNTSWFYLSAEPGISPQQSAMSARISTLVVTPQNNAFFIAWSWNGPGITAYPTALIGGSTTFEVYVTLPNVAPLSTDLVGMTEGNSFTIVCDNAGIPVDEPVDIHVRAVTKGVASNYLTAEDKVALVIGTASLDGTSIPYMEGAGFNFNENHNGVNYTTDGWVMDDGGWGTDAKLDIGSTYAAVDPQYGAAFLLLQ